MRHRHPGIRMSLRVIEPGLHSVIVDAGRPHSRSLGVPLGGAADQSSLAIGNALVGNPPDCAAVEITLKGPALQANCDTACVVFGAPFEIVVSPSVNSPKRKRTNVNAGRTFTLRAASTVHIRGTAVGTRAYLCVHGGFDTAIILESRTALQPLKAGDELACRPSAVGTRWIDNLDAAGSDAAPLRFLDGPQADRFSANAVSKSSFIVTPSSNRMGLRLSGPPLPPAASELVSEPVCPGSVQVTGDGGCIILGVDGQTIGGYPKIAQIISADLDRLGQLRPGDTITFRRVTLDEAEATFQERRKRLQERLTRLRVTYEES
jgi:antagonist of KipI